MPGRAKVSGVLRDNPAKSRFELVDDEGAVVGWVLYRQEAPDRIVYVRTRVEPEHEGHGYGSALAKGVLDEARRRGLRVEPVCPFIRAYLERHPEQADLVPPGWTPPPR